MEDLLQLLPADLRELVPVIEPSPPSGLVPREPSFPTVAQEVMYACGASHPRDPTRASGGWVAGQVGGLAWLGLAWHGWARLDLTQRSRGSLAPQSSGETRARVELR